MKRSPWSFTVVVLAAALYFTTATGTVVGGDNPEFAALFGASGVAHPSGYPLYVLWLRAMSWLPAATPALGAAWATASLSVLSLALLSRASRAAGASDEGTAVALAIYAFSPVAWSLAIHAEVFTLNVALAAAILWVASPDFPRDGGTRATLLGGLAGLALANHLSSVLLAPVGIYGAIAAVTSARFRGRATVGGILAFATCLVVPYASILISARSAPWPWVWGEPKDLHALLRHAMRADYGTTSLAAGGAAPNVGPNLLALAASFAEGPWIVGSLLAVLGAIGLLRVRSPKRPFAVALLGTIVLAGPAFVARFNLPATGLYRHVVARFHLLPLALAVPLVASGVDALVRRVPTSALAGTKATALRGFAIVGVSMAGSLTAWSGIREGSRPTIDQHLRAVFQVLPKDAILVTDRDEQFGGALYVQRALGLRPDVTVVAPGLASTAWYGRALGRMLGVPLAVRRVGRDVDPESLARALAGLGRPLFFVEDASKGRVPLERLRTVPWGPLARFVPESEELPSPEALERETAALYARMDVDLTILDETTWQASVVHLYALPWIALARARTAAGETEAAARDLARARAIAPWITP
ncbi:MAG: DUF2723 domain-containing protein [Polyangiaceae bacterium]